MNVICERTDCEYRKENNFMQKLMTCRKQAITVNKRGFCLSRKKSTQQGEVKEINNDKTF